MAKRKPGGKRVKRRKPVDKKKPQKKELPDKGRRQGYKPDPSARQLEIYHAVCTGRSYADVAEDYNVTPGAISASYHKVRKWIIPEWLTDIRELKTDQTTRLMHIFNESMEAWRNSKKVKITRKFREGENTKGGFSEEVVEQRETSGEPAFLQMAMNALKSVRDIWGIDEPLVVKHTGEVRVAGRSMEDVRAEALERIDKARARIIEIEAVQSTPKLEIDGMTPEEEAMIAEIEKGATDEK